jgi:hypothetical protein
MIRGFRGWMRSRAELVQKVKKLFEQAFRTQKKPRQECCRGW